MRLQRPESVARNLRIRRQRPEERSQAAHARIVPAGPAVFVGDERLVGRLASRDPRLDRREREMPVRVDERDASEYEYEYGWDRTNYPSMQGGRQAVHRLR